MVRHKTPGRDRTYTPLLFHRIFLKICLLASKFCGYFQEFPTDQPILLPIKTRRSSDDHDYSSLLAFQVSGMPAHHQRSSIDRAWARTVPPLQGDPNSAAYDWYINTSTRPNRYYRGALPVWCKPHHAERFSASLSGPVARRHRQTPRKALSTGARATRIDPNPQARS